MSSGGKRREESLKIPHPLITFFIVINLCYLMPCIAFKPDLLPSPSYTGYLGKFFLYMSEEHKSLVTIMLFVAVLVHLFEAVMAMIFSVYLGYSLKSSLKWSTNVFVNGVFALRFLIIELYEEESKSQEYRESIKYDKIR